MATSKPRILVAEDELIVARDILQQLADLGYEPVGHVTCAEDAITKTRELLPDLVLMDIQLASAMDGIAAAQAIRDQCAVPVVFLTAFSAEAILERAKLTEPYGYILKPFSERELRTVLEMALYKHKAEVQLQEGARQNQAILDNMVDGVITIDTEGAIESFNKAASAMFGYAPEEVLGRNVSMLMPGVHGAHHNHYLGHYKTTRERRIIGKPRELEGLRRDGSVFPMNLAVSEISRLGQTTFIGLVRDMSQRREDESEIRRLAFYDLLTGLPNRRLLTERLGHAMLSLARSGGHGALMLLDLDHFKTLNDTLGHSMGDELLIQVATRLTSCLRKGDSVARMGGDEFVMLLEDLNCHGHIAARQAETIANKVLETLRQVYVLRGQVCTSTPSIGVVVFKQDHEAMEELLKKADVAMYQAKAAGRNIARLFDPAMQALATAQAQLEQDLRQGLARNEFVLHYQVQVDTYGAPAGAEALLRWNHPLRGFVPPLQFIPLAEETGVILPLGQWVLETACAQLREWSRNPATAHWTIAVNVSAVQLGQEDFVDKVLQALTKTQALGDLLKLELTESMLVHDIEGTIVKMNAIKLLGVGFSLDDFGTGYSSLSYLKRLPLDQLKIDQSFVRDVLLDASDAVIARTIVALGHTLGLTVIAEGVESKGQRDFLVSVGCDAFQGYLFGRPGPICNVPDKVEDATAPMAL